MLKIMKPNIPIISVSQQVHHLLMELLHLLPSLEDIKPTQLLSKIGQL